MPRLGDDSRAARRTGRRGPWSTQVAMNTAAALTGVVRPSSLFHVSAAEKWSSRLRYAARRQAVRIDDMSRRALALSEE